MAHHNDTTTTTAEARLYICCYNDHLSAQHSSGITCLRVNGTPWLQPQQLQPSGWMYIWSPWYNSLLYCCTVHEVLMLLKYMHDMHMLMLLATMAAVPCP
jgi:hypothetical protein